MLITASLGLMSSFTERYSCCYCCYTGTLHTGVRDLLLAAAHPGLGFKIAELPQQSRRFFTATRYDVSVNSGTSSARMNGRINTPRNLWTLGGRGAGWRGAGRSRSKQADQWKRRSAAERQNDETLQPRISAAVRL